MIKLTKTIIDKLHIPVPDFFARYSQATRNGTRPMFNDVNEMSDRGWETMLDEGVNVSLFGTIINNYS